jgi:HK97 family phage prohead protease
MQYTTWTPTELKATDVSPTGMFSGYAAVFGNKDGNGDVVDHGSFTKTLNEAHASKAHKATTALYPLLWQHQEKEPIGSIIDAEQDQRGLLVKGQIDVDTPLGQRAYSAVKKGYVKGLSIGYDAIKSVFGRDARHLTEIRLWEGSLVTFPANTEAAIHEIKGRRAPAVDRLEYELKAAFSKFERDALEEDIPHLTAVMTGESARLFDREQKRIAARNWEWDWEAGRQAELALLAFFATRAIKRDEGDDD